MKEIYFFKKTEKHKKLSELYGGNGPVRYRNVVLFDRNSLKGKANFFQEMNVSRMKTLFSSCRNGDIYVYVYSLHSKKMVSIEKLCMYPWRSFSIDL